MNNQSKLTVNEFLEWLNGINYNKVIIFDFAKGEYVFSGIAKKEIKKFNNYTCLSFKFYKGDLIIIVDRGNKGCKPFKAKNKNL